MSGASACIADSAASTGVNLDCVSTNNADDMGLSASVVPAVQAHFQTGAPHAMCGTSSTYI